MNTEIIHTLEKETRNILIADAGSTKVDWALISTYGEVIGRCKTEGINALLAEEEDVKACLDQVKQMLPAADVAEVYYYGAGCASERVCARMTQLLAEAWPAAQVDVESDLLAAARALFGTKPGVACILGTGSNSCLYNGCEIENNVPSLGYILGDEGSGAALGKRLISDAFKRQLPEKVREEFLSEFGMTLSDILDRVYRTPAPNKFLASIVPFIKRNIWNPYLYSLVREEFTAFIKRNVAMYAGSHFLPVGFIGSIAVHFEDVLRDAASAQGFKVDTIMSSPLEGLIAFHSQSKDD